MVANLNLDSLDAEFDLLEDDFFVILPGDIDLGPEDNDPMFADSNSDSWYKLGDWRGPIRDFYAKLVEFARHAKTEIGDKYPELQMTVYFNRVDLSCRQKSFNHAILKVRSNHLADRSTSYPVGKECFAELHIERLEDGFNLKQMFYAGVGDNKSSRTVMNLANKIAANVNGKISEEVSCQAISTDTIKVRNIESGGFLTNVLYYLKAFDGRHFRRMKIRTKFAPVAKVKKTERRKKKTEKLVTLSAARDVTSAFPENHLPWFRRDTSRKVSGW